MVLLHWPKWIIPFCLTWLFWGDMHILQVCLLITDVDCSSEHPCWRWQSKDNIYIFLSTLKLQSREFLSHKKFDCTCSKHTRLDHLDQNVILSLVNLQLRRHCDPQCTTLPLCCQGYKCNSSVSSVTLTCCHHHLVHVFHPYEMTQSGDKFFFVDIPLCFFLNVM